VGHSGTLYPNGDLLCQVAVHHRGLGHRHPFVVRGRLERGVDPLYLFSESRGGYPDLFGMVCLAGVVVNDSLRLIHATNRIRKSGVSAQD
jgi:hypothetical protein